VSGTTTPRSWFIGAVETEQAYDDFQRMREVIKLEQFYERIHPDLHSLLLDKNPKTLTDAANSQMNIRQLGKNT